MPFVKNVKNKAYFKRYQVKYRRRREGKTDFFARRRLVSQEKCKYNSPKYRLIVRITNSRVICQVASATMVGDKVLDSCDSSELPRYGVSVGLTNYPAAYCAGLLIARRVLTKIGMADNFTGLDGECGDEYHVEENDEGERRPFKALLDVGLRRTTTGARVFAALKGAADGGLHVPHSVGRFPGFTKAEEKGDDSKYDAEAHKMRIYGAHIAEYMDKLEEEDQAKYERQFALFHKNGIDSEKLESMYKDCHAAIRKDPNRPEKEKKEIKHRVAGNVVHDETNNKTWKRYKKISLKQKRDRVKQKIQAAVKKAQAAAE